MNILGQYNFGLYHVHTRYNFKFMDTFLNDSHFYEIDTEDIHSLNKKICFFHETFHFLQDLSNGACLLKDEVIHDVAGVLLRLISDFSKFGDVILPLKNNEFFNGEINNKITEYKNWEKLDFLEKVFYEKLVISVSKRDEVVKYHISGLDLMEAITVVKTMHVIQNLVRNDEERSFINRVVDDLQLTFSNLPSTYSSAYNLYKDTCFRTTNTEDTFDTDDWKREGDVKLNDICFIFTADIALEIPTFDYIQYRIREYGNSIEDFIPPLRYSSMITCLQKNRGMPDSPSNDASLFYSELFDWFAEKNNWPTYNETIDSWEGNIYEKKVQRGLMSDGFKLRAIAEKKNIPKGF